jgi:hypothetical protein
MKEANEDESLNSYFAKMGLDKLNASAKNNSGSEECFVEFKKIEVVSPDHPDGAF